MKTNQFIILIAALFFLSCSKENITGSALGITGIWEVDTFNKDNSTTYLRVNKLSERSALVFKDKNIFQSWDHGFCGTPPLSYYLTEGHYDIKNDSMISLNINHYFFKNKTINIIDLQTDKLIIKIVN